MVSHFSNWKCLLNVYFMLVSINKEIQLFYKTDVSISLTIFYDVSLITYKNHFIELNDAGESLAFLQSFKFKGILVKC